MKKGFTLIELLIVVAIIAILAAIAVPNFLEAQVRAKVSRAKSDMRSYATGIETYYVDNNQYPIHGSGGTGTFTNYGITVNRNPAGTAGPYNRYINGASTAIQNMYSFGARPASGAGSTIYLLTTPIAYITSYFPDPFADTKGATFGYYTDGQGWIQWSLGPDGDESTQGDLGSVDGAAGTANMEVETIYTSTLSQPHEWLIAGSAGTTADTQYTYDPTNGTVSGGDVWRVRQ